MIIDDVTTCITDLPTHIRSYVIAMFDGRYCIVLNSKLNHETLLNAYRHELSHILNGDFDKLNADSIECNAHSI